MGRSCYWLLVVLSPVSLTGKMLTKRPVDSCHRNGLADLKGPEAKKMPQKATTLKT